MLTICRQPGVVSQVLEAFDLLTEAAGTSKAIVYGAASQKTVIFGQSVEVLGVKGVYDAMELDISELRNKVFH